MPSGFTPSCLAKGRARWCWMPGESLGRSSSWLINLIFLSDLQQHRLEGAALTPPGSDLGWIWTLGHQDMAQGGTGWHRAHRNSPVQDLCHLCTAVAPRVPTTAWHSVTRTAGASPTPPWRLWDYGSAQMGTWHSQMAAPDPNTSCMTPGNEPCTCLGSSGRRGDPSRAQGMIPREC